VYTDEKERKNELLLLLMPFWKETNERPEDCLKTTACAFTNESREPFFFRYFFGALYIDDPACCCCCCCSVREGGGEGATASSLHNPTLPTLASVINCTPCTHGPRHRELPSNYPTRTCAHFSNSSSSSRLVMYSQVAYCCCFAMRHYTCYYYVIIIVGRFNIPADGRTNEWSTCQSIDQ